MYVVAVNGSPRKKGNTHTLLTKVLEPLAASGWTTELVQLGGKKIRGCRACFKCMETKNLRCIFDDDQFNGVLEKMLKADAIVLGSPTYFTDVSAELKALIDRSGFVAYANGNAFRGKIRGRRGGRAPGRRHPRVRHHQPHVPDVGHAGAWFHLLESGLRPG